MATMTRRCSPSSAWLVFLAYLLAGCGQSQTLSLTPSQAPFTVAPPTATLLPTAALTAVPRPQVQLTYLSKLGPYQRLFAINFDDQGSSFPSTGEPTLLLEEEDNPESRGPILSYAWSPDGRLLALEKMGANNATDIYLVELETLTIENITATPNLKESNPQWAPNRERLFFMSHSDTGYQFVSMKPDGTDRHVHLDTQLSADKLLILGGDASLSPDGTHIVFNAYGDNGRYQLYSSRLDGSDLRRLAPSHTDNINPIFSSDGEHIAFYRFGDQEELCCGHIWTILKDGTQLFNVTKLRGEYYGPSWSPVGDWIAVSVAAGGQFDPGDIYVIKSDGSVMLNLTLSRDDDRAPAWRTVEK